MPKPPGDVQASTPAWVVDHREELTDRGWLLYSWPDNRVTVGGWGFGSERMVELDKAQTARVYREVASTLLAHADELAVGAAEESP